MERPVNIVLLAEDDPVSRRFLQEALVGFGLRCEAVADGEAALAWARRQAFDLLLFDRELPGLRGDAVLRHLRQDAAAGSRDASAIALTAHDDTAVRDALREAGFAAVGPKPLSIERLRALLAPWLPPHPAPAWNDALGLAATGGDRGTLQALREMMRAELPGQAQSIAQAIAAGNPTPARATLHRLRAACGFCGAEALAREVDALHAALATIDSPDLDAFEAAVAALLAEPAR